MVDTGALVTIGLAADGLHRGGDYGYAALRVVRPGYFGVEHGKLRRAAPVAMLFDEGGGLIAIGAGARDAALGEQNAGAQQIRIRQEQRHGAAPGDGFRLAQRFASGARIAAAPQRFGMGEQARAQYKLPVGAAQSGEGSGGALGAILAEPSAPNGVVRQRRAGLGQSAETDVEEPIVPFSQIDGKSPSHIGFGGTPAGEQ